MKNLFIVFYTNVLPKYFMDVYGIDLYDKLGLMFVEKNGYKDFRYKYWKSMQTLMLESFSKQIYEWCENNGISQLNIPYHILDENIMRKYGKVDNGTQLLMVIFSLQAK